MVDRAAQFFAASHHCAGGEAQSYKPCTALHSLARHQAAARAESLHAHQVSSKDAGTGSFGRSFADFVLRHHRPRKLIIFSRDEQKQHEMRAGLPDCTGSPVRYFLGDVRDRDRLYRALDGVDIVVHAAALKQVPAGEYNPLEVIKTNVLGVANLIDAAIDRDVKKVIALSSDKAASPISLYGASKLCADKLIIAGNNYSGQHATKFSVVRYGNVVGSRGSVIPFFLQQRQSGVLPITDPRMTRFWITLEQGVAFVLACLERMVGGEIFVPKLPSMNIMDLAHALAPDCRTEIIGARAGEKLHEVMVPEDDARQTLEYDDRFVIVPTFRECGAPAYAGRNGGRPCPDGFRYSSDNNAIWLTVEELRTMMKAYSPAPSGSQSSTC